MVDETIEINNCELFACYAADDFEKWKLIIGQDVVDREDGQGSVVNVYLTEDHVIVIEVHFEGKNKTKKLSREGYSRNLVDCSLPETLEIDELTIKRCKDRKAEEERQKKAARERARRQHEELPAKLQQEKEGLALQRHFIELKHKYYASQYPDDSPTSRLYPILLELEDKRPLDENEIRWLEDEELFGVPAIYYEMCFRKEIDCDNQWHEVRASRYWRKAGHPEKALKITADVKYPHAPKRTSAVLTTRGGAFADLGELEEAERCAHEAIRWHSSSWHPYNLLGRIYFMKDQYDEGTEYFMRAIELGASPQELERTGRSAPKWYSYFLQGYAYALSKKCRLAADYFHKAYTMAERSDAAQDAKKAIIKVLDNLDKDIRIAIARHLLQIAPTKYKWVQRYL